VGNGAGGLLDQQRLSASPEPIRLVVAALRFGLMRSCQNVQYRERPEPCEYDYVTEKSERWLLTILP
jgi:hypothetical protein